MKNLTANSGQGHKKQEMNKALYFNYRSYIGWLSDQYQLNAQSQFLLSCMDGRTSDKQLRHKFRNRFGIELSDKAFKKFLNLLTRQKLLAQRVNNCLLSKMQISAIIDEGRKFKKSKIRPPMFSGMMYPASRVALVRQLRLCFAAVSDTKLRGILEKKERLRGLLVPHSNLELSGPCAAWAYKAILMTALPKVIVILAPAHVSNLRYHFSVLEKSFRTPLGVAALETKFVKNLARRCDFNITADSAAHWTEHSIEIQLLFLQYIFNCAKKRLKIVPILCGYPDGASPFSRSSRGIREKFLDALRICIHEYGKYVLVVATGDLCHQDRDRPMRGFHARNQKLIRCLGDVDTEFLKKYCIYGKYHTCGGCSFSAFLDLMIPQKGVILNYSWASRTNIIKKEYGERNYFGFAQIGYVSMVF